MFTLLDDFRAVDVLLDARRACLLRCCACNGTRQNVVAVLSYSKSEVIIYGFYIYFLGDHITLASLAHVKDRIEYQLIFKNN